MRLQVFLSHSGICSRRKALDLVKMGKVKVNDETIIEPSFKIDPSRDKILFNNKTVRIKKDTYIMLNKPLGVTTTKKDRFAEKTVFDLLPKELKHLHPVGRLDKNTSGLLLLTNDGNLTYKLTHPRFEVKKLYEVTCDKKLSDKDKERLEKGIILEDVRTSPCAIKITNDKIHIEIHEGKKRQVRRMFSQLGYTVTKLKRIGEGTINLGNLKPGCWRNLNDKETESLKNG